MTRKVPRKELHRPRTRREEDGHDNQTRWRRTFRAAMASKFRALGLDFDALGIERHCTFFEAKAGHRIQCPGDASFELGVVVSGHVITCLRTPRRLVAQLVGPGHAVCLPTALAPGGATEFYTEAHDDAVLAFVPQEVLEGLVARLSGPLRFGVVAYAARAMSRTILWKSRLLVVEATEGLRQEIAGIAATASGTHDGSVGPRLTHDTLKDFGGWSRAFVTRTLPRVAGVTSTGAKRFVVDPALLAAPLPFRRPPAPASPPPASDPHGALRARLRNALRALAARAGVPPSSLERLSEGAVLRWYYDGGEPIDVGTATDTVFLVDGAARLECRPVVGTGERHVALQVARSGQFLAFPSSPVEGGSRRLIAAVAERPCLVATIGRNPMTQMLDALPPRDVLQLIACCLHIFSRVLCDTMTMLDLSGVERVWVQLQRLALTFPVEDPRGTAIGIPVSRDTLAALAGLTPGMVSRATGRLEDIRWIEPVGDRWLLLGFHDRGVAA
jgi:CRP-like cAMP-binding protein